MSKSLARFVATAAMGIGFTVSAHSAFADVADGPLRARIDKIEASWTAQNAEAVADVYSKDAIITGQDNPVPAVGHAAVVAKVKDLMSDAKTAKISIYKAEQLGKESALTWVQWDVEPKTAGEKTFVAKSLFVWKQIGGQWFIVADMFAIGPMAAK